MAPLLLLDVKPIPDAGDLCRHSECQTRHRTPLSRFCRGIQILGMGLASRLSSLEPKASTPWGHLRALVGNGRLLQGLPEGMPSHTARNNQSRRKRRQEFQAARDAIFRRSGKPLNKLSSAIPPRARLGRCLQSFSSPRFHPSLLRPVIETPHTRAESYIKYHNSDEEHTILYIASWLDLI